MAYVEITEAHWKCLQIDVALRLWLHFDLVSSFFLAADLCRTENPWRLTSSIGVLAAGLSERWILQSLRILIEFSILNGTGGDSPACHVQRFQGTPDSFVLCGSYDVTSKLVCDFWCNSFSILFLHDATRATEQSHPQWANEGDPMNLGRIIG